MTRPWAPLLLCRLCSRARTWDPGGPWWTMVDHGGLAMYGATTLPIIEASLKVSRSPSSASRATECDRACSLSFQTLVRTRSQQWFLESLRRFDKPFIIFHHNLYCSLLVGTQTCKTGHGGILLPCDRNTLLRRQKRRSPWWRAPGSRLCQVGPGGTKLPQEIPRNGQIQRSKMVKHSKQRQQRQHPPIPCALRAQFSVAERYLGFVTVTLSWRCVLIDLQGKPWLNWLSQLHAIPILNLLIFEKHYSGLYSDYTVRRTYLQSCTWSSLPSLRDAKHFNRGRYLTSWHPGMNSKTCPYLHFQRFQGPKKSSCGQISSTILIKSEGFHRCHVDPFNTI